MALNLKNQLSQSQLHDKVNGMGSGTYYLADNPKYYEIQRSNNFVFYVDSLFNDVNVGDTLVAQNTYAATNGEDIIRISCSKAFVPTFKQNAITVKRGNNTMKFAGVPEFDSGSISLNDYIGAGTKDLMYAWQQMSYDVMTEKVGLAEDYKRTAYLLEYTPDNQLVRSWKLLGCWISSLEFGEFNYENNEKMQITATIEYDKGYIDVSDVDM